MGVVAGDLVEITWNHPTLGNGVLFAKSAEDHTIDQGGIRTTDDNNGIDGGGRMLATKNRVRWSWEFVVSNDQNVADEQGKMKALAASPDETDFTFSVINGTVWQAKGCPVGDLQVNGNAGTMSLKLAGGGELKKL